MGLWTHQSPCLRKWSWKNDMVEFTKESDYMKHIHMMYFIMKQIDYFYEIDVLTCKKDEKILKLVETCNGIKSWPTHQIHEILKLSMK
jgi:hypothetical protein